MTNTTARLRAAAALTGAGLLACAFAQPAAAQPYYDYSGNPIYQPAPPAYASRPLTVQRHSYQGRAYDPYHGPQTIVTAPIAAASTLVALPFRVVNSVFPPDARDPRVIVGAPVYAAGQVAQVPFRVMQAPFGGWDYMPE